MARKSRRVNGNKSVVGIGSIKTPETCAGVYLRLSSKDNADKDSILNQKAIIESYLYNMPNIKVIKYYIDDGVSSYKDFRPAFEEMMQDIKCGLINTVIVKDVSRFGRNYIETGTYLETIFPRIGIRFISVSEAIDSQDKSSMEFEIAIKSLLNHFYAKDISTKVKSVVKQKQILGEYVASRLPYGYKKAIVEGRTIFIIDLEKALIVKNIFELALQGASYYKIAGEFNLKGIKSPGGNDWTVKAVSRIINNRFYTGLIEMGKTENTLGGMKPVINKNQQDWITIDNHHEEIVDIEIFEKVQRVIEAKKDKRLNTDSNIIRNNNIVNQSQANKINKLLYCGDCGRKMKKQVWGSNIYYVCPKYSETKGSCSLKSWRLDRIINSLVRELEEQVVRLDSKPEICDLGETFTEQIFLFQNEIDQLQLKRELIYDAFMESKQRQARDKSNLLKLVIEELKDPKDNNNADNDNIPKLECVIKRIHVFDNKLDIEN